MSAPIADRSPDPATTEAVRTDPATADPVTTDPASRGLTRISPHVVERIAAFACQRLADVVVPEYEPNAPRSATTRVRAEINGRLARLSVVLGVRYPSGVAAFAADVRSVVTSDVENLCGLRVVGVDVEALPVNLHRRQRVQ